MELFDSLSRSSFGCISPVGRKRLFGSPSVPKKKRRKSRNDDVYGGLWSPNFLGFEWFLNHDEYFATWKHFLVQKNIDQLAQTKKLLKEVKYIGRTTFSSVDIVKYIFEVNRLLGQPPEVKYLSLDILDRFLLVQYLDIREAAIQRNWSDEKLSSTIQRIRIQRPLRIVSAIQLAAKYSSNSQVLTTADLKEVLEYIGYSRPEEDMSSQIIKSEIRLYKSLNFVLPTVTPLTFVEMFFEGLRHIIINFDASNFLKTCVKVLDLTIIHHSIIYKKLQRKLSRSYDRSLADDRSFFTLEGDYMYLATAVIRAAAIIQEPLQVTAEKITEFFSLTTEYEKYEIEILAAYILEIILADLMI